MSDFGRKAFSTKLEEKITPDASKSAYDKTKETVTDTADRIAGGAQSDKDKSFTQEAFDKSRHEKDQQAHGGSTETVLDKVKKSVGLGDNQ